MSKEDLRSSLAKARDEFLEKNPELCESRTLLLDTKNNSYDKARQFLKNRIERAFIAGWEAHTKHQKKKRVRNENEQDN